jgi:response regulator RpfG family c-di-GMP phosphodiesterase
MKLIRSKSPAETAPVDEPAASRHSWKVLVVDDEKDIRTLTRLNLKGFSFDRRELHFIEAASAAEARQCLADNDDIALALIDVVMETDDAGLKLVQYIREELANKMIRLVIRTGQPGVAPERFVIDNFDIDDYKDKTELTATRLYTTVRSSIKAYRDLKTIDMNRLGLSRVLSAAPDLYRISNSSLNHFFEGVLTQIVGLCNLADMSFISTIDGLVATLDGREVTVRATTGPVADQQRIDEIRAQCSEAVASGALPEKIRQNGIVIPLKIGPDPVGFVYVEPTRELSESDLDLLKVMAQQCSSALENLRLHLDLQSAYDNAIDMLAEIAEFKDKTTGEHIQRIDNYTRMVALEMGISPDEAVLYGKASRLHDVGKIGIPDDILRKPGRLTAEEFEIMKTHVTIGASVLSHDKSLEMARDVALSHHERWDGTGYPAGIPASQVSLLTRIVSVVDVFDALVSRRPYKQPWSVEEAANNVRNAAGSQFDPAVVEAFMRLLERGDFTPFIASVARDNEADLPEDVPLISR